MEFTCSDDKILLLDGGFGTTLEDVFGNRISGALWSASLVDKDPDTIVNAHLAFLDAGSDVLLTSTYQCAFETFERAGYSRSDAINLMHKSVRLASQAKEKYRRTNDTRRQIQVVLSLGPFGATLSPAQEFDGIYPPPYGPHTFTIDGKNVNAFQDSTTEELAVKALTDFHYGRLRVLTEGDVWQLLDGIAFETVPLVREVKAIRRAMGRLGSHLDLAGLAEKPWWISTVWPSGVHPEESSPGGGRRTAVDVAQALLLEDSAGPDGSTIPDGIGINCTHIEDLEEVVGKLHVAINDIKPIRKPFLVLYPNGGGVYDIVNRTWIPPEEGKGNTEISRNAWAHRLVSISKRERMAGIWKGLVIGGCCKTTPVHIELLAKALGSQ